MAQQIPQEALDTVKTLKQAGFEAYFVGGCVRDILLESEPDDWDVATDATPEEILSLFEHSFYENEFGTVGVVFEDAEDPRHQTIEVTTYREESGYSDKRRPDQVSFTKNINDDLKRRDFTVNAIALSPDLSANNPSDVSRGTFVDPYNGQNDLKAQTIKAVGNPSQRFAEDALRIMRAVRLATTLDFSIENSTQEAIQNHTEELKNIAQERIRDEFSKIIDSKNPMTGMFLMERLGILHVILPEFEKSVGIEQNQAHAFTVWEHLLRTAQYAADKDLPFHVKLASIFHDIGKPYTREWSNKKKDWAFHGHDVVGSRVTKTVLERLKYPKETVSRVTKLVRWHMFFTDTDQISYSAVRRMVRNVGKENVEDLLSLRRADRIGTGRPKESPYRLRKYEAMIAEVLRDPISVDMLKIDGSEIMKLTDSKPGPHIGYILHALLEEVLDDPDKNIAEYLKNRAEELFKLPNKELEELGKKGKSTQEEYDEATIKEIRKKYWVK
ncbi:MAG: CCA tRNA nucleotidyltransferase [Candidatus Campbellbacteria bacterium]|nr:CCA tRNA nucleotidyltransferase [Candidatus Campbellbacteria bacterium]